MQRPVAVARGAGMTAGLELHRRADGLFVLADTSTDGRFAEDVAVWSSHLKPSSTKKTKNATKQDPKKTHR